MSNNHSFKFNIAFIGFEKQTQQELEDTLNKNENLFLLPAKRADGKESSGIVIHIYFFKGLVNLDQSKLGVSRAENARILFIGDFSDFKSVFACIRAGSYGCISLANMSFEITPAIMSVGQDKIYISPVFANIIDNYFKNGLQNNIYNNLFTHQEHKLIQLLTTGALYKEVAYKMRISENTVRSHVRNIYGKLKVHSKTELTQKVLKFNLTSSIIYCFSEYIACLCY